MTQLFLGLAPPEDIRAWMAGLCAGVPGARWVAPENIHLTLRFIGEVEPETARDLTTPLARIEAPPFDLTLKGLGHFGSPRRLRSLWVGVDPSPPLMALQEKIEAAVQRAGFAPEGRNFTPHITLARFKSGTRVKLGDYLSGNALFTAGPFTVDGFVLFSSHLSHKGASYAIEQVFPLG